MEVRRGLIQEVCAVRKYGTRTKRSGNMDRLGDFFLGGSGFDRGLFVKL